MQALFYKSLMLGSKLFGNWLFRLAAGTVAAGFFIFSPRRRAVGRRFYGALYPGKSHPQLNQCTFRQFQSFTHLFLDRYLQRQNDPLRYTFEGLDYIIEAHRRGEGAILLMSHMGSWEVAAHALKKRLTDLRLMLLMGIRQKEAIQKMQKESIRSDGITIVGIDQEGGSPFDIVEAVHFLRSGGLLSMAGDVVWRKDQRTITADLLGHRVQLPDAPYSLALVTGAPIIVFFAFRTDEGRYYIRAHEPIHVHAAFRRERPAAIQQAAQTYVNHMQDALRQHPYQWFHFDQFLGPNVSSTIPQK
jgi:predicted LPLAT superfamily acyltransferase